MKDLLILGVDPGTTCAYALLNTKGKLVHVQSSRILTLPALVFEVINFGHVLVVSSDVAPMPNFVKETAKRMGARQLFPERSLLIKEKVNLLRNWRKDFFEDKELKLQNQHEKDAMAAAVYALRQIRPLIMHIDTVLEKKNKMFLSQSVKQMLITRKNNLSLYHAIEELEE